MAEYLHPSCNVCSKMQHRCHKYVIIKVVVLYVSDHITKSTLKTHTIFDSIRSVFQRNSEMMNGSLPMKEKAQRFMTKVANLLSAKAEMDALMICMYLLGNPNHYTSHSFILFYWQSYVGEVQWVFKEITKKQQPKMIVDKEKKQDCRSISSARLYPSCT